LLYRAREDVGIFVPDPTNHKERHAFTGNGFEMRSKQNSPPQVAGSGTAHKGRGVFNSPVGELWQQGKEINHGMRREPGQTAPPLGLRARHAVTLLFFYFFPALIVLCGAGVPYCNMSAAFVNSAAAIS
jgi:hypothetical protein